MLYSLRGKKQKKKKTEKEREKKKLIKTTTTSKGISQWFGLMMIIIMIMKGVRICVRDVKIYFIKYFPLSRSFFHSTSTHHHISSSFLYGWSWWCLRFTFLFISKTCVSFYFFFILFYFSSTVFFLFLFLLLTPHPSIHNECSHFKFFKRKDLIHSTPLMISYIVAEFHFIIIYFQNDFFLWLLCLWNTWL